MAVIATDIGLVFKHYVNIHFIMDYMLVGAYLLLLMFIIHHIWEKLLDLNFQSYLYDSLFGQVHVHCNRLQKVNNALRSLFIL